MTTVTVAVDRPYQVHIGYGAARGVVAGIPEDAARVAVVFSSPLRKLAQFIGDDTDALMIEVPDAEAAKSAEVVFACWEKLGAAGFTRNDVIVAVGGGAVTDLAGFVAATWLRGIRVIHVPTSLLAMVDAAVGGKTGINTAAGKNLVGSFHHPYAVYADLAALQALPQHELEQGMAEVVKCGLIADLSILDVCGSMVAPLVWDSPELIELVTRAVQVKADVVADDFTESKPGGLGREILNYGHTLGHAIERNENFKWRHGHAISVGMVFVSHLARLDGRLTEADVQVHESHLRRFNLPVTYRADAWPQLRQAMNLDKKTRGDALRFVVLDAIGRPAILKAPSEELLASAFACVAE